MPYCVFSRELLPHKGCSSRSAVNALREQVEMNKIYSSSLQQAMIARRQGSILRHATLSNAIHRWFVSDGKARRTTIDKAPHSCGMGLMAGVTCAVAGACCAIPMASSEPHVYSHHATLTNHRSTSTNADADHARTGGRRDSCGGDGQ